MKSAIAATTLAAVAIAAGMLTGGAHVVHASGFTSLDLGLTSFGRILVDPASSQVFVSSPADSAIVVTDLGGTIKKRIDGEAGADAMVIRGSTLYVTLTTLGEIDQIDTGTLSETGVLVSGLFKPNDLSYAGGKLWTTSGQCGGSSVKLASVDPSAVTPAVTLYPSAFTNANALNYCAEFAADHAASPTVILAWDPGISPSTATTFDVSSGSPVQVSSASVSEIKDAALAPDGTHFHAAGYSVGYSIGEYNLSDFTSDGTTYPEGAYPIGVDSTGANGGLVIGEIDEIYGYAFYIYQVGVPTAPIATFSSSNVAVTTSFGRSVAFAPNGMTAYGISLPSPTQVVLNILPIPYVAPLGSPAPPTAVTADAGVGSATVSWTPGDPGKSAVSGYTITSSGGGVVRVGPAVNSVTITGLSPSSHTFTVTATNSYGTSAPSLPSTASAIADGGTYHALPPARILDTRNGTGGFPIHRVAPGSPLDVQVGGLGGVPATGVSAVVLNVTVTNPTGSGFVTAYPAGAARPNASNLNYVAGLTVPNLVEVAVGSLGRVDLYVGGSSTDLIADVEGWVGNSTNSYGGAGLFEAQSPARILDTRTGTGAPHAKLGAGQSIVLQVAGAGSVPSSHVAAVVLNVTVTNPTAASYLTVFPSDDSSVPLTSNLNFSAGQTVANRVIVPLSATGQVTIFNGSGTVDVIADVSGWFTDSTGTGGFAFVGTVPSRLLDTRNCRCRMGPGKVLGLQWIGPPFVAAFVLNVTVTHTTGYGYLTVYPYVVSMGGPPPLASDVNYGPGQTVPNLTVAALNVNYESFDVYNGGGSADVVIDADGYYGAAPGGTCSVAATVVQANEIGSYHLPRMRTQTGRTVIVKGAP
jgi:hypothetical protein